ncbi:MAG: procyclic acidic repetitive family protein [Clostridia bacterium]|nr:procyclic acidic repetitive family protein [Clostridia bacterium]
MKKFLLVLLAAALVFGATTVFSFADLYGEPVDVDEVDNYATWIDSFYWNGERLPGEGRAVIDEYMDDKTLYDVDSRESCGFLGWVCFTEKVKVFGYYLTFADGNTSLVTDESFTYINEPDLVSTVEGWWPGSGEFIQRYLITVPIAELKGRCEITAVAVLESDEVVLMNSYNHPERSTWVEFEFSGGEEENPTEAPVENPTEAPVENPTEAPEEPTQEPEVEPTQEPEVEPTQEPEVEPTQEPEVEPTQEPAAEPTDEPAGNPTEVPTGAIDPGKKKGCGSAITALSAPLMLAAAAFVLRKKKN